MKAVQKEETAASSSRLRFFKILFSIKPRFIKFQNMDRHYSDLELVRHDETARAPERDWDATAFELDASALAPQVSKTLVRDKNLC